MKWLYFPPVFSLFFLIFTILFRNENLAFRIPTVIWGITIAAYICLCCISAFYISNRGGENNKGVWFLAEGLLLAVMSLQSGAFFLAWLGMVMFIVGLSLAFFYATERHTFMYGGAQDAAQSEEDMEDARERIDNVLDKLELPICVTDSKGVVVCVTQKFCEAIDMIEENVVGEIVSEVLPIDEETVTLESGKWWISRVKDGARYYFSLLPTQGCKPMLQNSAAALSMPPRGIGIFDEETGLYVEDYRILRGPQEISRSQRYKRSICGILLELTFNTASDIGISDEQRRMLFAAFASKVKQALRIPDCGFLLPDKRIQILLPETPLAGAKTLLSRLTTLPQDVFDDAVRNAVNPKVKAGAFFYNGTTKMEYSIFSAALEEEFIKSVESDAPRSIPGKAA